MDKEQDIFDEISEPLNPGDTWYMICTKWFNTWKKHVGISTSIQGDDPGPIDNSRLFEKGNTDKLQGHLMDDLDYTLIPEAAWNKLVNKYGLMEGQKPIAREVIQTGSFSVQCMVEIYPPEIRMRLHENEETIHKEIFSRIRTIGEVHKRMREIFEIPDNRKTRLYIQDSSDSLKEENSLNECGVGSTQVLVLETQNSDDTWPRLSPPSYKQAMSTSSSSIVKKNPIPSNTSTMNGGFYSTRSTSSNFYSSRNERPGLCGLSNLGNTCFMNSAIQCLSNVPSLTIYFQEKKYVEELNRHNPLGMHGRLAEAYATLIHDIWSGDMSSVSPRDFKYNVGSFAPRFSGYQQHDSQELLAFLIDGLHEDLNRIKQKPYIELKDSDGRKDEDVAVEAWSNHLQRNDSIIVDTFHGLFKSTLVCPDCDRISITFDPFGFLSLPLPAIRERNIVCSFVPRNPMKPVIKHSVSIPKNGCMNDVARALAERTGCEARSIVLAEIYSYNIPKVYKGSDKVKDYRDRDDLFAYDLGAADDEPQYAKVLMRRNERMGGKLFAIPFLIPIKAGETTYRKLYNSVLGAVSRFIKHEYKDDVKMLDELQKCDISESLNGSDVDGIHEDREEDTSEEDEETQLFKLVTVNSFSATVLKELKDTDKPITFLRDIRIAADWDPKLCDEYVMSDWYSTFEDDPSVSADPRREKNMSLRDCMNLFTTKEKLGEHDLWYCSGCKEHKQATKKFDLWSLPPVLIIHLKRFSYTRWTREKIGTMVDFPIRDLDMSEFIINPQKESWPKQKKTYNLIGVSNHYGGMGGGHYTAFARNYQDDKWYYFDDSSVTSSSEDRVQTKAAYMLMYQRQDMEEWVKSGGKSGFNFLESMVSPRGCSPAGFTYEGLTNGNPPTKIFRNGSGGLSDGDTNDQEMDEMDTS